MNLFRLIAVCSFFLPLSCRTSVETCTESDSQKGPVSISIILGEDKDGKVFYNSAKQVFRANEIYQTDVVIDNIRSIEGVFEFLRTFDSPISELNLVSHGNPWQGMSVSLLNEGDRCNKSNLHNLLRTNWSKGFKLNSISSETEINIYSCGIGQDKDYVALLQELFDEVSIGTPKLNVSERFVSFDNSYGINASEFYHVISKYKYEDPTVIVNKLKSKYGDNYVNWEKAYCSTPTVELEPKPYGFVMAIYWTIDVDKNDEKVLMAIEEDLLAWMKTQDYLVEELQQSKLDFNHFHWNYFKSPQGDVCQIRIKGFAFVEGVLV